MLVKSSKRLRFRAVLLQGVWAGHVSEKFEEAEVSCSFTARRDVRTK